RLLPIYTAQRSLVFARESSTFPLFGNRPCPAAGWQLRGGRGARGLYRLSRIGACGLHGCSQQRIIGASRRDRSGDACPEPTDEVVVLGLATGNSRRAINALALRAAQIARTH